MPETKLKTQSYGSQFFAPEGFLINGKIVPSVASNNLTVALKNLAGNDPSASDPIFVRLGDTIRTISSALSVTLNAGTNYFNSGSSELATKEIDYFVYLGYETDETAVRIGFGRIPYACRQDDYSGTNTNEKHIAFNDALDSGNNVSVIGRFAATLSASASYNWSVPTFNATNLIQRPIFTTRWLDWSPQISYGFGSTNPTSNTITISKYMVVSPETVKLHFVATLVVGSTDRGVFQYTAPFNYKTIYSPLSSFQTVLRTTASLPALYAGGAYLENTNAITFYAAGLGTYNNGTFQVHGEYYI